MNVGEQLAEVFYHKGVLGGSELRGSVLRRVRSLSAALIFNLLGIVAVANQSKVFHHRNICVDCYLHIIQL